MARLGGGGDITELEARLLEVTEQRDRALAKVEAHECWWDDHTGDTYFIAVCSAKTNDGDPCPMRPWVTDADRDEYCSGGNPDYIEPDTGAHIDCTHPPTRCKILKVTGAAGERAERAERQLEDERRVWAGPGYWQTDTGLKHREAITRAERAEAALKEARDLLSKIAAGPVPGDGGWVEAVRDRARAVLGDPPTTGKDA